MLGKLLLILSVLMLPSLILGFAYSEPRQVLLSFLASMAISAILGYLLSFRKPKTQDFYSQESIVLVALAWFSLSAVGALPFYLSSGASLVDALFESFSGFTTTGASVLSHTLDSLPRSLLFWRSFTLMIGGMGMLVFIIQVLPNLGSHGLYIMRAEMPGPNFGKLESKVSSSINILYGIYLSMTAVLTLLLRLGGVPWFDSVLLAFGTAGTGGFNFYPNSVAHYGNPYVEVVIAIGMMVFGMSYIFFYLIAIRKYRQVLRSEELHWYLGIILVSVVLISIGVYQRYDSFGSMLRDVFFTVSSVNSTTAYTTVDFRPWPVYTHVILLFLMFVGAMSGSTSSGLKVARLAVFVKSIRQEMRRMVSPDRAVPINYDGKELSQREQRSIAFYLMTYLAVFLILLAVISLDTKTFSSAFSAVIATLNNVGGGLDLLGPSMDYSALHDRTKLIMCLAMVLGRLEIYPVLILFAPSTWRKV